MRTDGKCSTTKRMACFYLIAIPDKILIPPSGIVLVYDLTNRKSNTNLLKWLGEYHQAVTGGTCKFTCDGVFLLKIISVLVLCVHSRQRHL